MVLNKGDEFLDVVTGVIYRIHAISMHYSFVTVSKRGGSDEKYISVMNPIAYDQIIWKINKLEWIPATPAAKVMYGKG